MLPRTILRTSYRLSTRTFCQKMRVHNNSTASTDLDRIPTTDYYSKELYVNQKYKEQERGKEVSQDEVKNPDAVLSELFEKAVREVESSVGGRRGRGRHAVRANDDIDWNWGMPVIQKSEEVLPPDRPTYEELDSIRAAKPTRSLASIINDSKNLQKLVDLGIDLNAWESKQELGLAVKLDFDRDVVPTLKFLSDIGIPDDLQGDVLTRNPAILEQTIEDMETRVAYLVSKKFSKDDIALIAFDSGWLTFSVKGVDSRLGFMQKTFGLTGNEVRALTVKCPQLILTNKLVPRIQQTLFTFNEEMGFSAEELKSIVLKEPQMIMKRRITDYLVNFDLLHNQIGIPHELIAQFPLSLKQSTYIVSGRHEYLKKVGRAQYSPLLPMYVSPAMLTEGTDHEFCENVAKCDLELFHRFLRTL
eukprot:TRINITY_DN3322_c0_g1_i2.p1 TRINITY_DN3322_c0_g1~~TRINITY_DN3322_c0_g1_i2.p1  ORF type:complete len:417 (+),score=68.54 TRINITY_DN3322_c0_g1_i2:308-1558(+)